MDKRFQQILENRKWECADRWSLRGKQLPRGHHRDNLLHGIQGRLRAPRQVSQSEEDDTEQEIQGWHDDSSHYHTTSLTLSEPPDSLAKRNNDRQNIWGSSLKELNQCDGEWERLSWRFRTFGRNFVPQTKCLLLRAFLEEAKLPGDHSAPGPQLYLELLLRGALPRGGKKLNIQIFLKQ